MPFSAIQEGCGNGVLINIHNCSNEMWGKVKDTELDTFYNNSNIPYDYAIKIANFIIEYGFPMMIKNNSNISVNVIKNVENAYFFVNPYSKGSNHYYMRNKYNCTATDLRKGKKQGFFLMGVCVLGKFNRVDWIQSYYKNTNIVHSIFCIMKRYLGITAISSNIALRPEFWYKYLKKYHDITSFDEFLIFLWKSCVSIENYYHIAFDIKGYDYIYEDCDEEYINLKLIYDY